MSDIVPGYVEEVMLSWQSLTEALGDLIKQYVVYTRRKSQHQRKDGAENESLNSKTGSYLQRKKAGLNEKQYKKTLISSKGPKISK